MEEAVLQSVSLAALPLAQLFAALRDRQLHPQYPALALLAKPRRAFLSTRRL